MQVYELRLHSLRLLTGFDRTIMTFLLDINFETFGHVFFSFLDTERSKTVFFRVKKILQTCANRGVQFHADWSSRGRVL